MKYIAFISVTASFLFCTSCVPNQSPASKIPMRPGETWSLEISDIALSTSTKSNFSVIGNPVKAQKDSDGLFFIKSNKIYLKSEEINERWEYVDLKFDQTTGFASYFPQKNNNENTLVIFADNSKDLMELAGCSFYGWKDNSTQMTGVLLDNKDPTAKNISCKIEKIFRQE